MKQKPDKVRRSSRRHNIRILKTLTLFAAHRATSDNRVTLYHDGRSLYAKMIKDIRDAERRVLFEIHEINDDDAGWLFARALAESAQAGKDVRIIYDSLGSFGVTKIFQYMQEKGVKVIEYKPIRFFNLVRNRGLRKPRKWRHFIYYFFNNLFRAFDLWGRNHRKSLVIDGAIAYNGGFNIGDCWSENKGEIPWRDTHARVEGSAARDLELLFADTWYKETGEHISDTHVPRPAENTASRSGNGTSVYVLREKSRLYGRTTQRMYLSHFRGAEKRIILIGAYFLPTRKILHALYDAVNKRGVQVDILLPQQSDMPSIMHASRRLIAPLLEHGISVYLWQPSVLHAKTLVIDGNWSIVGTSNPEATSLYHSLEVDFAFDDERIGQMLTERFERDLEQSKKLTLQQWAQDPSRDRWREWRWSILYKALQILGSWK